MKNVYSDSCGASFHSMDAGAPPLLEDILGWQGMVELMYWAGAQCKVVATCDHPEPAVRLLTSAIPLILKPSQRQLRSRQVKTVTHAVPTSAPATSGLKLPRNVRTVPNVL